MGNYFENYLLGEKLYIQTVMPVCERFNLTYMEFTVLMFLANHPQYDTATDIVKHRNLTKSHVSVSVRNLEEKGFLKCEHKDGNRRTIHLIIPESGSKIVKMGQKAQKNFYEKVHEGLNKEEKEKLMSFFEIIGKNIERNLK